MPSGRILANKMHWKVGQGRCWYPVLWETSSDGIQTRKRGTTFWTPGHRLANSSISLGPYSFCTAILNILPNNSSVVDEKEKTGVLSSSGICQVGDLFFRRCGFQRLVHHYCLVASMNWINFMRCVSRQLGLGEIGRKILIREEFSIGVCVCVLDRWHIIPFRFGVQSHSVSRLISHLLPLYPPL